MKNLLCFTVLIMIAFHSMGQDFPNAWIGEYEGEMTIGYVDKPNSYAQVTYSLQEIIQDSVWSHKMTFASEEYGDAVKDYVIRAKRKGDQCNYVLDELNGVEMEMSYLNSCFYSFFMLSGNTYSTTFRRLSDGSLLWDLYVTSQDSKKVDIIKTVEGEDMRSFEVNSFKPSLHQTVIFKKK